LTVLKQGADYFIGTRDPSGTRLVRESHESWPNYDAALQAYQLGDWHLASGFDGGQSVAQQEGQQTKKKAEKVEKAPPVYSQPLDTDNDKWFEQLELDLEKHDHSAPSPHAKTPPLGAPTWHPNNILP